MLELSVLDHDFDQAIEHLGDALAAVTDAWMPKSTANNLGMIRNARESRHEDTSRLTAIIEELLKREVG